MNLLKQKIVDYAKVEAGFDDCRITSPFVNDVLNYYREWLANNYHGNMAYLENHLPFKEDPEKLLKDVKSAIVVIKNYKNVKAKKLSQDLKIARYAVGQDYHLIIKEKLQRIEEHIKSLAPDSECYSAIDSRPVAERSLALKAGLGFLGKNTMIIKPGLGSYFFIGVIFTTLELTYDQQMDWNCGQCRLCLDGCPTNALLENYQMDATKCISYMTIEQKLELSEEQLEQTQGWMFGCDICQEICPYNSESVSLTDWPEFHPEQGVGFNAFETIQNEKDIPKNTPLYRSRKRLIPNLTKMEDSKKRPETRD